MSIFNSKTHYCYNTLWHPHCVVIGNEYLRVRQTILDVWSQHSSRYTVWNCRSRSLILLSLSGGFMHWQRIMEFMLIMQIMQILPTYLSATCWLARVLLLAATRVRYNGCSRRFFPVNNFASRELYASGGGLLVAPTNAPELFKKTKTEGMLILSM